MEQNLTIRHFGIAHADVNDEASRECYINYSNVWMKNFIPSDFRHFALLYSGDKICLNSQRHHYAGVSASRWLCVKNNVADPMDETSIHVLKNCCFTKPFFG